MITIVDSGAGNVRSVLNMFQRHGHDARVVTTAVEVAEASKIILPGVGAFDAGMAALRQQGLDEAIRNAVNNRGATLLGICLGMHLLFDGSDEGTTQGLSLLRGCVRRFPTAPHRLKIPHMGWNVVRNVRPSALLAEPDPDRRFYFVHSYYVDCVDQTDVAGVTEYGNEFTSVVHRGRICGVQFHPEKSHRFGAALLSSFVKM